MMQENFASKFEMLQERAIVVFAFCVPLLTLLHRYRNKTYVPIPPLVVLGAILFLLGLYVACGKLGELVHPNRLLLYLVGAVVFFEMMAYLLHDARFGTKFLFGRMGFLAIMFGVFLNALDVRTIQKGMRAYLVGTIILSVLTVLHAFNIFSLPFAMAKLPHRTFLGFRFPVRRTVGIAMSFGEYGIISNLALAYLLFSIPLKRGMERLLAVVASILIVVGILIAQTRSVLLGSAMVLGFGIISAYSSARWREHSRFRRVSLATFITNVIVLAIVFLLTFMPILGDIEALDVKTKAGHENVVRRVEWNWYAVDMIRARPLVGWGHYAYNQQVGKLLHHHFLEEAVATGIPGGIVYTLFFMTLLYTAWRIHARAEDTRIQTIAGALWIALFGSMVTWQWFPGFLVESIGFLAGIILAMNNVTAKLSIEQRE